MQNEQILTAVIVVAIMALIGRVLINQQQKGRINWGKLILIFVVCGTFLGTFLAIDPYRVEKWEEGEAGKWITFADHPIGRTAGDIDEITTIRNGVVPIFFTANVTEIEHSGYYKRKLSESSDPNVQRDILVSQSDESRTAIQRKTSAFNITKNPQDPNDYVGIYIVTLEGGEKDLAVLTDYDAHTGRLPVSSAKIADAKMQDVAEKSGLDPAGSLAYIQSFDFERFGSQPATYLYLKFISALMAAFIVGILGYIIYALITKKANK